ncbi:MAG: ribonuclease HI [Syntrophomonadaceae bacterium]|jgi:ribonuclease HI|nr:ribonuclease HI [Syntrophomonadaceae bacterium]
MRVITIYTDGACSGNPGPGGWGAVLLYGEHRKEIWGGEPATTNQRMELMAVIQALKALKVEKWAVEVYSDSAYVVNAFKQRWIDKWQKNGWKNSKNEPVANQDLWQKLLWLCRKNKVTLKKVAGHSGDELNERCDYLARQAIKELTTQDEG